MLSLSVHLRSAMFSLIIHNNAHPDTGMVECNVESIQTARTRTTDTGSSPVEGGDLPTESAVPVPVAVKTLGALCNLQSTPARLCNSSQPHLC